MPGPPADASPTREVFASHLRTPLSAGGLVDLWRRAGEVFLPWYEQIGTEAKTAATLHADETGWRVNGERTKAQTVR